MTTPFPIAAAADASAALTSEVGNEAVRVPNTSMLPSTENVAAASPCHAADASRHNKAHAMAGRICAVRDPSVAGTRSNFRSIPLGSLAAAVLLGAVIARILRR